MISQQKTTVTENESSRTVTEDGIVHFDATGRRRARMKSQAVARASDTSVPAPAEASNSLPIKTSDVAATNPKSGDVSQWKHRVQAKSNTPSTVEQTSVKSQSATKSSAPQTPTAPVFAASVPSSPSVATKTESSGRKVATAEEYRKFLVGFVVEQTGYPEEIVELDSDLEADLGIDSIKIAQMMGELLEQFKLNLDAIKVKSTDELRTLRQIINLLVESQGAVESIAETSVPASSNVDASVVEPVPKPKSDLIAPRPNRVAEMEKFLIQFVVEQTGYPEEIVELDADLEADLGIDSIKIAQMVGELNEYFGLEVANLRNRTADDFKTLRTIINAVSESNISATSDTSIAAKTASPEVKPKSSSASAVVANSSVSETHSPKNEMSASSRRSAGDLQKFLVQFVVEQTGYPEEIVELESDLEADLGLDSIKIAQMMGELNEYFRIDMTEYSGRSMDDFKTIGTIIRFLAK